MLECSSNHIVLKVIRKIVLKLKSFVLFDCLFSHTLTTKENKKNVGIIVFHSFALGAMSNYFIQIGRGRYLHIFGLFVANRTEQTMGERHIRTEIIFDFS